MSSKDHVYTVSEQTASGRPQLNIYGGALEEAGISSGDRIQAVPTADGIIIREYECPHNSLSHKVLDVYSCDDCGQEFEMGENDE